MDYFKIPFYLLFSLSQLSRIKSECKISGANVGAKM